MRRIAVALLGVLVSLFVMFIPSLQFAGSTDSSIDVATITDYRATFDVAKDGTLTAVEDLTVDFPVDKHGIYRFFDIASLSNPHVRYVPKDISVTRDGNPERVDISTRSGGQFIVARVGDPNVTMTGSHRYRISYRIDGVLSAEGSGSQFYWNLIPSGWQMGITQARISVNLPSPATSLRCAVGSGQGRDCQVETSAKGFVITTGTLSPHTPVTAQAALPDTPAPGQVSVPWSVRYDPVFGRHVPLLIGVLVVGLLAAIAGIWAGRSVREPEPPFPLMYAPPKGIGPAQAAYVMNERITDDMFAATMLQLGSDGVATVNGSGGALSIAGTGDRHATTDEISADTALALGVADGSTFHVSRENLEAGKQLKQVRAGFNGKVAQWGRNSGYVDTSTRPGLLALLWVLCIIAAGACFVFNIFGMSVIGLPFAMFASFAYPVLLPTSRTFRTKTGRDLWSQVGGFYRVLSTPSSVKRFEFSGRKELYLAYIPWAVAFGCAEAWAQKYRVEVGEEPPVPSYFNGGMFYYGAMGAPISPANFAGDFNSTVGGAISAYQASIAPSSSSGGGGFGGGFSGGGGGGGGGGGSW